MLANTQANTGMHSTARCCTSSRYPWPVAKNRVDLQEPFLPSGTCARRRRPSRLNDEASEVVDLCAGRERPVPTFSCQANCGKQKQTKVLPSTLPELQITTVADDTGRVIDSG